jgi:ubiquinone/menaquinone biosynthesis C-methylase UbiE
MTKKRIIETIEGIQGDFNVTMYNQMQRRLRDRGWIVTDNIIKSGINKGLALEIGPGPGYLGLEWLKKTNNTTLKGIEISPDMVKLAQQNAAEYGFENRVEYRIGNAESIPYEENKFDAVFSNGSLHEWATPIQIVDEIHRVLKPGGQYFISDLRRDLSIFIKAFLYSVTKPKEIRPGLISSINAAYIKNEIIAVLNQSKLKGAIVKTNPLGFTISGKK